ncbi:hypothetical protein KKF32_05115 [Patescibacteria group bacterium]|nr:hypothetical protein [Patescibacteria group bacterium]
MSWIKPFSKATFKVFAGQVLEGFQPIDFFHFFPLWHDLWVAKITEIIKKLNLGNKHFKDIKYLLPPPSNIRAILLKLIASYHASSIKNKNEYKLVANFFAKILQESCTNDPFSLTSNPYHSKEEIRDLVQTIPWKEADTTIARKIGQLITAVGSLVHGQYNDVVTDLGWETYGPYQIQHLKQNYTLLIRHFPNLAPKELWPQKYLASAKELIIYALYQDVKWEIYVVGCHTVSKKGNPVTGMKKYAVIADDKTVSQEKMIEFIKESSNKAEAVYQEIKGMDFEQLKLMVMTQECYQLKLLFDKADINWKPTKEMLERIKNKPLLKNIFPHGKFIETADEFMKIFGVKKFAKEVLQEKI